MNITELTVHELQEKLASKELTVTEITKAYADRIAEKEPDVQAFVTTLTDEAIEQSKEIEKKVNNGEIESNFAGIPIGIKDNLCTKGIKTTCSSKMLENFVSPYDATVIEKLNNEGLINLGKLNMDEFAMGGSTETSAFKKTKNPWNLNTVPGGSSGGSAAAVAAGMVPWALGSDTGGSIRQPSAFCGVVGLKPTYGLVSRYGLVAFASSLDQIGPITKDVYDSAMLLNLIAGHDSKDTTSIERPKVDYTKALKNDVKGLKIGVPKEFFGEGINEEVKAKLQEAIEKYGELFLNKIFDKSEVEYCKNTGKMEYQHYAARFAAKEAVFKAISNLIDYEKQDIWKNIVIKNDIKGRPFVEFYGSIEFLNMEVISMDLSISHIKDYAIANFVMLINE